MPQSLSQVILHIIFSTANRKRWLDDNIRDRVHAYIATTLRDQKTQAFRVGGTDDHIHIACNLPRNFNQSQLISHVKTNSSKWIKSIDSEYNAFSWQKGYGIFSVSHSHLDKLIEYIDNQKAHHKTTTFKEEFLTFLKKYQIQYDSNYIWE